jgi:hypothetical protein
MRNSFARLLWVALPRSHSMERPARPMQRLTGIEARRFHVDKGYRGHTANKFRV